MGDDCCSGWTLDVSVSEVTIVLHGHSLLTPELMEHYLDRVTTRATGADVARTRAHIALADRMTPAPAPAAEEPTNEG